MEDLFRFGRHHGMVVIYLAHYAKDVLPVVREIRFKIYLTINNPDKFFESIVHTYSIKDPGFLLRWKYFRDQLEFGIRGQKHKVINHKYNIIYDSSKRNKWSPEGYVAYESYFFNGFQWLFRGIEQIEGRFQWLFRGIQQIKGIFRGDV